MEKYEKLLNMLMNINKLIRFAAVCDKEGNILWHSQRDNIKNIIPLSETKKSIKRAADAWDEREAIVQKAAPNGVRGPSPFTENVQVSKTA